MARPPDGSCHASLVAWLEERVIRVQGALCVHGAPRADSTFDYLLGMQDVLDDMLLEARSLHRHNYPFVYKDNPAWPRLALADPSKPWLGQEGVFVVGGTPEERSTMKGDIVLRSAIVSDLERRGWRLDRYLDCLQPPDPGTHAVINCQKLCDAARNLGRPSSRADELVAEAAFPDDTKIACDWCGTETRHPYSFGPTTKLCEACAPCDRATDG